MKQTQGNIYLATIVEHFIENVLAPMMDNPIALVDEIDEERYLEMRTMVNDAFQVGPAPEFTGFVAEETEAGDVSTVLQEMLFKKYPPEKNEIMLSYDERLAFRDELIARLDEMVER